MQKIKIRLPATITNLGPGLHSLGLALGLYTTVEISARSDELLTLESKGEGEDALNVPLRHPVVIAMGRLFQRLERTRLGFNIKIYNQIPVRSGLGAETAFAVAGVLGANNLMNSPYRRDELLEIAAAASHADGVVAALFGGLTAGIFDDDELIARPLPVVSFQVVVALPRLEHYQSPILPEQIFRRDALHNLSRVPLLVEALRTGDLELLVRVLDDRLYASRHTSQITGYGHVVAMARRSGALGVTTCGDGPALLAFAHSQHEYIAEEMRLAFKSAGVEARTWVLPIDTQGVVVSVMQSA